MNELLTRADDSLPADVSLREQSLVVINAPHAFLTTFLSPYRERSGRHAPARLRTLGTTLGAIEVRRLDERTISIHTDGGYFEGRAHHIFWNPSQRRDAGAKQLLSDVTTEVVRATEDGRPMTVRFRFRDPAACRWVIWKGDRFRRFALPPVGERVTVPALDLGAVLFGSTRP